MNLRAILLILIFGLAASGCATKPASELHSGTETLTGIGSTNTTPITMAELVNVFVEVKLTQIKPGLDLTTGQETEIRQILTRQANGGFETVSNILRGTLSSQKLDEAAKQQANYRAQIKSLLTPQQLTAYEELNKARLARQAREMAATQLQQLQAPLQLKTNQMDEVFAILTRQAEAQLSNLETNATWTLNDRAQFHDNTEAFRDVLTPAQFKRFQKLRNQQSPADSSFLQELLRVLGPALLAGSLAGRH
ncbi:MAG TPA: hypothetical protein VNN22_01840 [Verrucomicrobiae bacterium]|nr:hypothetical protein [Verrucomicrobiae bacterium]